MAELFDATFDTDLSEFDATVTDGGDMAWDAGGGGRVSYLIDDTATMYGQVNHTALVPATHADFKVEVQPADLGTLTMAASDDFNLLRGYDNGALLWGVAYKYNSGSQGLELNLRDDNAVDQFGTVTAFPSGEPAAIEVRIHRADNATANNGTMRVYADGVEMSGAALTGLDIYDNFIYNQVRVGCTNGTDSGTSGTYYVTRLRARNDTTAFSSPPVLTVPGAQTCTLDVQKTISAAVTVADTDTDLATIRVQTSGSGTSTLTLGSATLDSGTLGTNDFTIGGTQANINTAIQTLKTDLAQVPWTDHTQNPPAGYVTATTTITLTATDDSALTDVETITCNWTMATGDGTARLTSSPADLATLNTFLSSILYDPITDSVATQAIYIKVTDATLEAVEDVVLMMASLDPVQSGSASGTGIMIGVHL